MERFNHNMLALAREARGLTQAELAERLEIGQGTLSKYESDILQPTDDAIGSLAGALGYPRTFFFEPGRPYGFPPFHYRRRKKLSAKTLGRIVAEMNIRRMHIAKMGVAYQRGNVTSFIPEIDRDDYNSRKGGRLDVEDVARLVREMWMLPKGPIPNMVELLESKHSIVVPCDFGTDLIDAMSQRIDGYPVLFFINSNAPADRVRHTLAHELGHMVLHTSSVKSDEEMEDEADAFAGAFLLPGDEIRPQLRKFDLRQLANMKSHWKVSMAAIAIRADRLKLITPYQKKMFFIEMGRLGYRKREPNEPPRELPSVLKRMVDFHRTKLNYSSEEMARLLSVLPAEFASMYGPDTFGTDTDPRRHLRVVK